MTISGKVELDSELLRRNRQLEVRVDELSRALHRVEAVFNLTAGVTHDARNALQVVLSEAGLLRDSVHEAEQREAATTVLEAAQNAEALLADLLSVARKADAKQRVVMPAEFVASCERVIRHVARDVDCTFDVDPASGPVCVEPPQLEAALINLSANARDAMPSGGRLTLSVRDVGDHVCFAVEDTGAGMTPEVLAHATEPFFTTKGERGTGLGLAMVSSFAERAGGRVRFESAPGRGTRVEVLIPRAQVLAPLEPGRVALVEKLEARVRTAALRDVLDAWARACPAGGLPRPVLVEDAVSAHGAHVMVIAVEGGALRLVHLGEALAHALGEGQVPDVTLAGPTFPGELAAAWRRAVDSRAPSYEFARFSLGDGRDATFERLILPAANDQQSTSHLIGVVFVDAGQASRP